MKMANPKTEREKSIIDKISNLPAFDRLNASSFYTSWEEDLHVPIQANTSREVAIKMVLMFAELSTSQNMSPEPVSSKDLENDDIEGIWLEIFVKKSCSFLIGVIYRPPNSFESTLNDMLDTCVSEGKETIVMGDLNVNYNKNSDNTEIK